MATAHTPGPWEVYLDGVDVAQADGHHVCHCEGDNDAEAQANARLIAAAPELLEALRRCEQWITRLAESGDAGWWNPADQTEVAEARAAIAKATGEPA